MTIDDIEQLVATKYKIIADKEEGVFGLWIHGCWDWFPELTIDEQKEAFLILLKRLLDEGKAVLFLPNGVEPIYRSQAGVDYIWDIPHEEMIKFMRKNWPQDVVDEDDINLTHFWYIPDRCPGIGWVDQETGKIVAS
jgi:hypothetical protein